MRLTLARWRLLACVLLAACVLVGVAPLALNDDVGEIGDVDGNGTVDALDVRLAKQHAQGMITLSAAEQARADFDGDGHVTEQDAFLIGQYILGLAWPARVPATTKVADPETVGALTKVLEDGTLRFSRATDLLDGLAPGDILVFDESSLTPDGLFRKVTSVLPTGGQVTVGTTSAVLAEAIEECDVSFSGDALFEPDRAALADSHVHPMWGITASYTKSFDKELATGLRATGEASFDMGFDISIKISWFKLQHFHAWAKVGETAKLDLIAGKAITIEEEVLVFKKRMKKIKFYIGPVPVIITPTLNVYVGANTEFFAEITTGIEQNMSIKAGIEYNKGVGWEPIWKPEFGFTYTPPTTSIGFGCRAYVKPELVLVFYDVGGPYVNMEAYAVAEGDYCRCGEPWWTADLGFDINLGLKVEILDFEIKWEPPPIYSKVFKHMEGDDLCPQFPSTPFSVGHDTGVACRVELNASGVTAPPGRGMEFHWTLDATPNEIVVRNVSGSVVTATQIPLLDPFYDTTSVITVDYPVPGVAHNVTLRVYDDDPLAEICLPNGRSAVASRTVTPQNAPPVVDFEAFPVASREGVVDFIGSAEDPDSPCDPTDFDNVEWQFDQDGTSYTGTSLEDLCSGSPLDPTYNYGAAGNHAVTLRVRDEYGAWGSKLGWIQSEDIAPYGEISSDPRVLDGNEEERRVPCEVTFDANVVDGDRSPPEERPADICVWDFGDSSDPVWQYADDGGTGSATHVYQRLGTYSVRVWLQDDTGAPCTAHGSLSGRTYDYDHPCDTYEFVVKPPGAGALRIYVTDSVTEEPLDGVIATGGGQSSAESAAGYITMVFDPGQAVSLSLAKDGYDSETVTITTGTSEGDVPSKSVGMTIDSSQTCALSGQVSHGLEGVSVTLTPKGGQLGLVTLSSTTGAGGGFTLSGIKGGYYTLEVSGGFYETFRMQHVLSLGGGLYEGITQKVSGVDKVVYTEVEGQLQVDSQANIVSTGSVSAVWCTDSGASVWVVRDGSVESWFAYDEDLGFMGSELHSPQPGEAEGLHGSSSSGGEPVVVGQTVAQRPFVWVPGSGDPNGADATTALLSKGALYGVWSDPSGGYVSVGRRWASEEEDCCWGDESYGLSMWDYSAACSEALSIGPTCPGDCRQLVMQAVHGTSRSNLFAVGCLYLSGYSPKIWKFSDALGVGFSCSACLLPPTASPPCFGPLYHGWVEMATPAGLSDVQLYDVWIQSESCGFAVGSKGTILKYDGTSWSKMTSDTTETLRGVWGRSADEVYAVGDDGTILLYDGSAWRKWIGTEVSSSFTDVWGSSTGIVVVVGWDGALYQEAPPMP